MVFKRRSLGIQEIHVWEWCKDIWYSNLIISTHFLPPVWEWCKDIWYSNGQLVYKGEGMFENDVKIYGIQTWKKWIIANVWFENDVKIYGIQTSSAGSTSSALFENDVKIYGIQTIKWAQICVISFENDVKIYGIQTHSCFHHFRKCLRMM